MPILIHMSAVGPAVGALDNGLSAELCTLLDAARDLRHPQLEQQISELYARVAAHAFNVVLFGQFKRGKSTLINALVGETILPTGIVPVTSVITVVRRGPEKKANVRFVLGHTEQCDMSDLSNYVTEAGNPDNARGVTLVEIQVPAPLLSNGLQLVDTPGLGSVYQHDSATEAFVDNIDIAVLVTGVDPPLAGDEMRLLLNASKRAACIMVAVNKADQLPDDDAAQAMCFVRQRLKHSLGREVPVFEVSAREYLVEGRPTREWAALNSRLTTMAFQDADAIRSHAVGQGMRRLTEATVRVINAKRTSLQEPIKASQHKIAVLRSAVEATKNSIAELRYALNAHLAGIEKQIRAEHIRFLEEILPPAYAHLRDGMNEVPSLRLRHTVWGHAAQISAPLLDNFIREVEPATARAYEAALNRFIGLANEYMTRIAKDAGVDRDLLPPALTKEHGFRRSRRLQYTELLSRTTIAPWRLLADLLLPRHAVLKSSLRSGEVYLRALLEANSSRIINDLQERLAASMQSVEASLREAMEQAVDLAEKVLRETTASLKLGDSVLQAELTHLDAWKEKIQPLAGKWDDALLH